MEKIVVLGVILGGLIMSFQTVHAGTLTKPLSIGSRGQEVILLQEHLIKVGLLKTNATGYFGSATFAAVKEFQRQNNLPVVGNVGPMTRNLINLLQAKISTTKTGVIKPDVKISTVTCEPSNPKISETIICSIIVYNDSPIGISKSFEVSTQGVTKVTVDGLNAWEKRVVKPTSGISFDSIGSKKINFFADIYNSIDESDENNNSFSMNIDIGAVQDNINQNATTKDCDSVSSSSLLLEAPTDIEKGKYSCFISTASVCSPVKLSLTGPEPRLIEISGKEGDYCRIKLIGKESFTCKYSLRDLSVYAKPIDSIGTSNGIKDTLEARAVSLILSTSLGAAGIIPTSTETGQKLDISCVKN